MLCAVHQQCSKGDVEGNLEQVFTTCLAWPSLGSWVWPSLLTSHATWVDSCPRAVPELAKSRCLAGLCSKQRSLPSPTLLSGCRYSPHKDADPLKPREPAIIERFIAYKNQDHGAWLRGGDVWLDNCQ